MSWTVPYSSCSALQELQRLSIFVMLSFVGLNAASALFGLMSKDWNISEMQDLLIGSQIMLVFSAFSATVYAIGLWLQGEPRSTSLTSEPCP